MNFFGLFWYSMFSLYSFWITNSLDLIKLFLAITRGQWWAERKMKKILDPHTPLVRPIVSKISSRYAVFSSLITQSFMQLQHRSLKSDERERLLQFFICATLLDDFFDSKSYSPEQLHQLSFYPETYSAHNNAERVYVSFSQALTQNAKTKSGYHTLQQAVYQAQMDSLHQSDASIGIDFLADITYRKGGYSVVLSRYYLDITSSVAEDRCWYQIGALIQLGNDIYDVYKDLKDGVYTLPLKMHSIIALENELTIQVRQYQKYIQALPVTAQKKKQLVFRTSIVYALCYVATDQLKSLEKKQGGKIDFKSVNRNALIVDMETWTNRFRVLKQLFILNHGINFKN